MKNKTSLAVKPKQNIHRKSFREKKCQQFHRFQAAPLKNIRFACQVGYVGTCIIKGTIKQTKIKEESHYT
jgi:hypothetical protein